MGNRAMVFFDNSECNGIGVYLHWNGGPESVCGFVKALNERGWTRSDYAPARFIQVVGEFFDAEGDNDGLSLGVFQAEFKTAWNDFGLDHSAYLVVNDNGKLVVEQRGKRVVLDKVGQEKCDGIAETLAAIRAKRSA